MNTYFMILISIAFVIEIHGGTPLAATNTIFITDDRKDFYSETNLFTKERIELANRREDSRPAEVDVNGGWGPIVDGFQMSLRLTKHIYSKHEPIQMKIILRNVSTNELKYNVRYGADDLTFDIKRSGSSQTTNSSPKNLPFIENLRLVKSGSSAIYVSYPNTQRVFLKTLDRLADVAETGEYEIVVKREIPAKDNQNSVEISSAAVRFRIE